MSIYFLHGDEPEIEFILTSQKNITYPEHNHVSVYTIICVLQGNILLKQNGQEQLYQENTQFIIPPYLPHYFYLNQDTTILSICIKTSYLKKQTLTNLAEVLQKNFLLLKKQYSIDLPPPSILISKLSIANQKNRSDKKTLSTITQICHQIENMPENTVLNWKNIPFSQFRFIRLFKENTGLSPHKFLIQNRVRKAQQLLLNSHCSLAEVAQATGFYDQSHFIRHFKAMVGLTPSEYQQSCVFFAKK